MPGSKQNVGGPFPVAWLVGIAAAAAVAARLLPDVW